jgi:phage-related protein
MPSTITESGRRAKDAANGYRLDSMFAEETRKSEQKKLLHLITLELPNNEGFLYYVEGNYDVRFDSRLYLKFPLKFSGASINSDGSVDKATITVANVNRELMYYVEYANGLRNMRVKIKSVYEDALDDLYTVQPDGSVIPTYEGRTVNGSSVIVRLPEPTSGDPYTNPSANNKAYIEDEYRIDNYTANEQAVSFTLDPIIDLDIRLPRRRFMVDSCYWLYKDAHTCKYSDTTTINPATVDSNVPGSGTTFWNCPCLKTFAACDARGNTLNFGGFPGISSSRRVML